MKKVITVLICLWICSVSAFGQDGGDIQVDLMQEDIVGLAVYPDGQTPVVDMPVRVWNLDKREIVYRSRTDQNGNFTIPRIEPGRNYLFVGRVRINLRIFETEAGSSPQSHDLIMAISRGMVVPARPNMMEVLIAPMIMRVPDEPRVVSP